MSVARGSRTVLNWIPEAVYGTPPGGNWNQFAFVSESLGGNINPITSEEIRADRARPAVRGGNISTQGQLVMELSPARFAPWWGHLLGDAPTTSAIVSAAVANTTAYVRGDIVQNALNDYLCIYSGTTSGTAAADLVGAIHGQVITSGTAKFVWADLDATTKYRHIFVPGSDFLANGLSFEKGIRGGTADAFFVFAGGRINSAQVQFTQEQIARVTWDLLFAANLAKSGATVAGTPVLIAEDPLVGFESAIQINGTINAVIREANFTITNDVDADDFTMGNRFRRDIPPKRRIINGSVTALFEDATEVDLWLAETEFALKFSGYNTGRFMSFEFPECKFFGDPVPKTSGAGTVMVTFQFEAYKQNAANDVEIVLKNTDATVTV